MNRFAGALLLGCCVVLSGCKEVVSVAKVGVRAERAFQDDTPITPVSQPDRYAMFSDILKVHRARAERVARISRALRVANAPICSVTRPDIGLSTHQLSDYPEPIRPLAMHFMEIEEDGRFVHFVVPDSPADDADIRRGERILSGWPVSDAAPLTLETEQGPQAIAIDPDTACAIPAFVVQSDRLNASTDGREIDLSSALVDQAGDDSGLAFIIAHEMAHVIRPPAEGASRWDVELQADADALVLMRNAGFDIDGTVRVWAAGVELHRDSQALSLTHPPVDIRLQALRRALSETQRRSSLVAPGEVLRLD